MLLKVFYTLRSAAIYLVRRLAAGLAAA